MSATSSSARLDAARTALATYDSNEDTYHALPDAEQEGKNYEDYEDGILANVHDLAAALRALAEPPPTVKAITELATEAWHGATAHISGESIIFQRKDMVAMLEAAVRAGVQAAWESWEPETAIATEVGNKPTEKAAEMIEHISDAIHVNEGDVYVNTHGAAIIVFDEEQIHVTSDGATATEDTTNYRTGWEA